MTPRAKDVFRAIADHGRAGRSGAGLADQRLLRIARVAELGSMPHHALVRSWLLYAVQQDQPPEGELDAGPHTTQLNIKLDDQHAGGVDTAKVTVTILGSDDVPSIVKESDPSTQTVIQTGEAARVIQLALKLSF